MKSLVFLMAVLLLVECWDWKERMLKENRTPKKSWKKADKSSVCEECKTIVTRFEKALQDPAKVSELKAILRMLCHETSYVEECKIFVDRLDYFIAHLQPYLDDPERACVKLRMCSNKKIETFLRISKAYLNRYEDKELIKADLICEECQFAASELKNLVEEERSQQEVKKFLSEEVCSRLGKYQGSCDLMLEEFLPSLFEELDKMLANTKQFCGDLGLCKTESLGSDEVVYDGKRKSRKYDTVLYTAIVASILKRTIANRVVLENTTDVYFVKKLNSFAQRVASTANSKCSGANCERVKKLILCEYCRYLSKYSVDGLKNPDFTSWLRKNLENSICSVLPETFESLCDNVIVSYLPELLAKCEKYLKSHDICKEKLHVCETR